MLPRLRLQSATAALADQCELSCASALPGAVFTVLFKPHDRVGRNSVLERALASYAGSPELDSPPLRKKTEHVYQQDTNRETLPCACDLSMT